MRALEDITGALDYQKFVGFFLSVLHPYSHAHIYTCIHNPLNKLDTQVGNKELHSHVDACDVCMSEILRGW